MSVRQRGQREVAGDDRHQQNKSERTLSRSMLIAAYFARFSGNHAAVCSAQRPS